MVSTIEPSQPAAMGICRGRRLSIERKNEAAVIHPAVAGKLGIDIRNSTAAFERDPNARKVRNQLDESSAVIGREVWQNSRMEDNQGRFWRSPGRERCGHFQNVAGCYGWGILC